MKPKIARRALSFDNKLQSDEFILSSGMNYTPFHLVYSATQAALALALVVKKNAEPVSIRFKGRGMQPFKPNLSAKEALEYCEFHFSKCTTPLGIYEATEGYDEHRLANCEIRINPDLTVDGHYCRGSLKMRDALASARARHVVGASLDFPPLRWAIDYCLRFNLIGPVVELTLFAEKVGVKREHVVVWEVRNF